MQVDEWEQSVNDAYEFLAFHLWGFETYKEEKQPGYLHIFCGDESRGVHLNHQEKYNTKLNPTRFVFQALNKLNTFNPTYCGLFNSTVKVMDGRVYLIEHSNDDHLTIPPYLLDNHEVEIK